MWLLYDMFLHLIAKRAVCCVRNGMKLNGMKMNAVVIDVLVCALVPCSYVFGFIFSELHSSLMESSCYCINTGNRCV